MEETGTAAEFLGTHHHSMDDKGRLVLPAPFRDQLGGGLVMTIGFDNCLSIHTPEGWEEARAQLRQLRTTNPAERQFIRLMASKAQRQTLDKQGRISIPGQLRDYARLTKDCAVVGADTKIEVWDAERWQEYEAASLAMLPESSQQFDIGIF